MTNTEREISEDIPWPKKRMVGKPRVLLITDNASLHWSITDQFGGKYTFNLVRTDEELKDFMIDKSVKPDVLLLDPSSLEDFSIRDINESVFGGSTIALISELDSESVTQVLKSGADFTHHKETVHLDLLDAQMGSLRKQYLRNSGGETVIRAGRLKIDLLERWVTRDDIPVKIGIVAFKMLEILGKNKGHIVPREKMIDYVWFNGNLDQLRALIKRLRKYIKYNLQEPEIIETISGFGYMLVDPDEK